MKKGEGVLSQTRGQPHIVTFFMKIFFEGLENKFGASWHQAPVATCLSCPSLKMFSWRRLFYWGRNTVSHGLRRN